MPIFVIQEHKSRNLHYDLRLESGGVLKSWAIPKQPSNNPKAKRLAIQVEDHDKNYAKFQGEIKEGYGKGTVKIWDSGNYSLESKTPNKIVFQIQGKRLKGKWVLLKTEFIDKKTGKPNDKAWLFFRIK